MISRCIGGVLLIVGTSIGGGMLALPIANASTGFIPSSVFLILCWAIMTCGAFFILEVNLYLPRGTHMISMAEATLGNYGLLATWLSYLFLLYVLLAAYISGGSDVFQSILQKSDMHLKEWHISTLFTLVFGFIVYSGIQQVDWANRILMFAKLAIYLILTVCIAPHIEWPNLQEENVRYFGSAMMLLFTSFGFAIIVPNLRNYFDDDIITLKKVIIIGSLIPLICYIAWDAVIIGTIPSHGKDGLQALIHNPHATSTLANLLATRVSSPWIMALFNFFTSICMLTAFLGVSLCLFSFFADGLKIQTRGVQGLALSLLTFLPPLFLVLYYPGAYIYALRYAGIFCIILLLLLPALMCYFGRKKFQARFKIAGGNYTPWIIIIISAVLLLHEVFHLKLL